MKYDKWPQCTLEAELKIFKLFGNTWVSCSAKFNIE